MGRRAGDSRQRDAWAGEQETTDGQGQEGRKQQAKGCMGRRAGDSRRTEALVGGQVTAGRRMHGQESRRQQMDRGLGRRAGNSRQRDGWEVEPNLWAGGQTLARGVNASARTAAVVEKWKN
jgi:hypothetical protein